MKIENFPFAPSRRAPPLQDLQFMHNWLQNKSFTKILEFGGGITTYVIADALKKFEKYVCVENYQPCIENISTHIENIEIVQDSWNSIPKEEYDFIFVDSSSCAPKGLKSINKNQSAIFRDDALHYIMDFVHPNCYFMVHDWSYHGGWLRVKKYFEDRNKNFTLIDSFKSKHGVGIYQKLVPVEGLEPPRPCEQ